MARLTWQVTSVAVDQVIPGVAGQVVVGSYVYFTTGEGHDGVVFVPNSRFSDKAKVRNDVHKAAAHLDEIAALSQE